MSPHGMRTPAIWTAPSREELAWAAGLFEGEGCALGVNRTRTPRCGAVQAELGMTDEGPVRHFHRVVGVGTVRGPLNRGNKPYWLWRAASFEATQHVMAVLWPWLHSRRRGQFRKGIEGANRAWALQRQPYYCDWCGLECVGSVRKAAHARWCRERKSLA